MCFHCHVASPSTLAGVASCVPLALPQAAFNNQEDDVDRPGASMVELPAPVQPDPPARPDTPAQPDQPRVGGPAGGVEGNPQDQDLVEPLPHICETKGCCDRINKDVLQLYFAIEKARRVKTLLVL
jgi:hypothetical protein